MEEERAEEINDSVVEEVRLTVPITDDPTIPTMTFRTWFLGATSCAALAFMNRFFDYRQNPVYISTDCIQLLLLPLGRLMAATLPTKPMRVPGTKWTFTMNPGPFSIKEHALTTIFAKSGAFSPYPVGIMTVMKAFFHRKFHPMSALLLSYTSQMVGYGYIGFFVKYLVDHSTMWWPNTLVTVSLFRTLHEVEVKLRGKLTRFQFFVIVSVTSFAYYIVPNYFFQSITSLSFVCWIWKHSVTAQQIGSGRNGFGLGSFMLDYTTVVYYLGNPFACPIDTIINIMVGFFVIFYVISPIIYWTNSFNAKRFPILSSNLFDEDGHEYNVSRVLDKETFTLDKQAYHSYSKVYLSAYYMIRYGFGNAMSSAAITSVLLFHGRSIWGHIKETFQKRQHEEGDVHNRLMKKYEPVPTWWYHAILISTTIVAVSLSAFNNQLQLPVWAVLFTIFTCMIITAPTAVICATTTLTVAPTDIQDTLITYLFAGRPLANMTYNAYAYNTIIHAANFLQDLKLGHYMKIPPKSMFAAQVVSTLISTHVNVAVAWWLLSTVDHICEPDRLPKGSPWTCPGEDVFFDSIVQLGVVGPAQLFLPPALYWWTYLFYIVGIIATILVWKLSRVPSMKWVGLINVPIFFCAGTFLLPARPVHMWTWAAVGVFFNFFLFRSFKDWWAKYNYVLSAGLSIGPAFVNFLVYIALNRQQIYGLNWWGMDVDDHCPLAHCPTAPGIKVEGCPVFL